VLLTANKCTPSPADPENGNFTILNGGGDAFGTVVQFRCDPGYQMRRGSPFAYCALDDEGNPMWSDDITQVECVGESGEGGKGWGGGEGGG
jgi:hypothetical protein